MRRRTWGGLLGPGMGAIGEGPFGEGGQGTPPAHGLQDPLVFLEGPPEQGVRQASPVEPGVVLQNVPSWKPFPVLRHHLLVDPLEVGQGSPLQGLHGREGVLAEGWGSPQGLLEEEGVVQPEGQVGPEAQQDEALPPLGNPVGRGIHHPSRHQAVGGDLSWREGQEILRGRGSGAWGPAVLLPPPARKQVEVAEVVLDGPDVGSPVGGEEARHVLEDEDQRPEEGQEPGVLQIEPPPQGEGALALLSLPPQDGEVLAGRSPTSTSGGWGGERRRLWRAMSPTA